MTPLPKKKMSRARSLKRKSQIKVNSPALTTCPHCNKKKLGHTVCPFCGYYKNRLVLNPRMHTKSKVIRENGDKQT